MSRVARRQRPAIALLVLLSWACVMASAHAVEAQPSDAGKGIAKPVGAAELLARMAEAVRSLNYEGTLVYLHENRLEAMDLQHQISNGEVHERLISLSGPVRAVVRAQERVMCVMPDGHPISVEQNGQSRFLETEGIDPDALVDHYQVRMLGEARIAGRDTDVVGIVPRDALRYGYRFHIDRETALPLKSDLIDQDQQPLEQLMFTSVEIGPPDGALPDVKGQPIRSAPATSADGEWRFREVPLGFELVMHDEMKQPDGSIIEHYMFTDRLSAYSVYIDQDTENGLEGVASIGAVHAAGRSLDGYQLIAVGEVPMQTVQQAVAGARRMAETEVEAGSR
ncbi:transcriptional regulator [Thiorhodococcus mannitoliphagus]|uniref:Transcriptional regulator n=1 Tax=Thiorhodococcus mannitoliphagus TaxID=329406 RepID=A0A6P1DVK1_9GAMM|nr:MucB/RseB C-terminal domain-containing protein [Thiorhodococcus mannitoliphagus]NEX20102.1 transcriptional regulator [Thiorhodococcus mannitoliphagus]